MDNYKKQVLQRVIDFYIEKSDADKKTIRTVACLMSDVEALTIPAVVDMFDLSEASTWIKISDQEPPKNIEVLAQCPKGVNYLTSWRTNYAVFSCQRELDSSWDWKWKLID
jgi:hypothetical protein